MANKYNHIEIENKWQDKWEKEKTFELEEDFKKESFYCLDMFPFLSGVGIHVGHPRGYVASDIFSHYKRMRGFNVLHPMGWDAFGLPAENYALKTGINPKISTVKNVEKFKEQLKNIGLSYDWSREINTTDPKYYKWTQWIFLQLFKKGLAYEAVMPINWCVSCKTGLANEEVVAGKCERCGSQVIKKDLRQWILKITKYADRLLEGLEGLDWPSRIKDMQVNWIGKSEGADIDFEIKGLKEKVKVFTTRPDTIFGATFLVLAPEYPLVNSILDKVDNSKEVEKYIEEARKKSDLERTDLNKDKTGVELKGIKAINPANGEEISVFIADYVLGFYGYGAIMSVPAHDERDFEFAKKFDLKITEVISGGDIDKEAYIKEGKLINSGEFNGIDSKISKNKITEWLEKEGIGKKAVNYKLRDWIFSRQRYWGEPIPLIHCEKCGIVPVPEEELPLMLPETENYIPSETGESPLANIPEWVNTKCPACGGSAKRETNTMPQWAGSCWYYLRFIDPNNTNELIDIKKEKMFMPVDLYIGGAEHAVLHLLYARFWHKFLYDIGVVSTEEPFKKLKNQGLIMADDGTKMSKSKGNTISPDDIIESHGADTFRTFEMFLAPFADPVAWNPKSINGVKKFLDKIFDLKTRVSEKADSSLDQITHQTIKKVTEDIENFKFNTAISALMILVNKFKTKEYLSKENYISLLKMVAPFAPHLAEELYSEFGEGYILKSEWPSYDKKMIIEKEVNTIIQINGKMRDTLLIKTGSSEKEVKELALASEKINKWIDGKEIKKIIYIQDRILNIVV